MQTIYQKVKQTDILALGLEAVFNVHMHMDFVLVSVFITSSLSGWIRVQTRVVVPMMTAKDNHIVHI